MRQTAEGQTTAISLAAAMYATGIAVYEEDIVTVLLADLG